MSLSSLLLDNTHADDLFFSSPAVWSSLFRSCTFSRPFFLSSAWTKRQFQLPETGDWSWLKEQESYAIAKMTAQCALHMGALKIFGTPWLRPRLLFPTFSRDFVRIDPLNVPTKFEVRSFIRSSDNRGYPKNLDIPWIRPRSFLSKIFNRLLFRLTL